MKTIMMIGGGIQEVRAVTYAQSLGYKVLVTDREPDAPCFKVADYKEQVNGRDVESLVACAIDYQIEGVFTLTELVTSVATVAGALDLPGASIKSAVLCQNKWLAKRQWQRCGMPTPRGFVAETPEEAKMVMDEFNSHAFAKPLVGFGGIGSGRVISVEQLFRHNKKVLIEEYLEGTHHDANGLITEHDNFIPLGITDRYFEEDRPFEREIRYPTKLAVKQQHILYDIMYKSAHALGIHGGPIKCDVILTEDGFKILEMAPRLHGPKNSLYVLPAVGWNPLEPVLKYITTGQADYAFKHEAPSHCIMRVGKSRRFEDWTLATGDSFEECEI